MNRDNDDLKKTIIQFRDNRDWGQFHKIKDLLIGINIEIAELQELFLWKSEQEIRKIDIEHVEDEVADIFIFLNYICDEFGIELEDVVRKKIQKNEEKYPIDKSKGSNKKYNKL
jgi:NTP pyrophosphatase (non-canonical NTP hydrolase)